jgi:hypothetical protein
VAASANNLSIFTFICSGRSVEAAFILPVVAVSTATVLPSLIALLMVLATHASVLRELSG